jgi:hypothetical protein
MTIAERVGNAQRILCAHMSSGKHGSNSKKEKEFMKVEHLFQVMVAETAFHELLINALTAYIARQSQASIDEIDAFIEQHSSDKRAAYVESVHMRLKKRIEELAADEASD